MSGFRVKLDIRKTAAADDQGIALLERFLGRRRPQQSNPPGCVRTIVGNDRLAQQGLDNRAGDVFGKLEDLRARTQATTAGQNGDLESGVDDLGRLLERPWRWKRQGVLVNICAMLGDIGWRALVLALRPVLDVFRDGNVRHRPQCQRRLNRFVYHVGDVGRSHDALVIRRNIHE